MSGTARAGRSRSKYIGKQIPLFGKPAPENYQHRASRTPPPSSGLPWPGWFSRIGQGLPTPVSSLASDNASKSKIRRGRCHLSQNQRHDIAPSSRLRALASIAHFPRPARFHIVCRARAGAERLEGALQDCPRAGRLRTRTGSLRWASLPAKGSAAIGALCVAGGWQRASGVARQHAPARATRPCRTHAARPHAVCSPPAPVPPSVQAALRPSMWSSRAVCV